MNKEYKSTVEHANRMTNEPSYDVGVRTDCTKAMNGQLPVNQVKRHLCSNLCGA